jgi:hypothetical protein
MRDDRRRRGGLAAPCALVVGRVESSRVLAEKSL